MSIIHVMKTKNNKKEREMVKRGVFIEDLDSKLDLVLEGFNMLSKKIEDLQSEMNRKFQEIDFKFDIVFEELRDIRKQMATQKV